MVRSTTQELVLVLLCAMAGCGGAQPQAYCFGYAGREHAGRALPEAGVGLWVPGAAPSNRPPPGDRGRLCRESEPLGPGEARVRVGSPRAEGSGAPRPAPTVRARVFGVDADWSETTDGRYYVTNVALGNHEAMVEVPCIGAPFGGCQPAWLGHAEGLEIFPIDDPISSARATLDFAFSPEDGLVGVGGHVTPLLRRVRESGLGFGFAVGYAELGLRQRLAINFAVEYDLTFPFRWLLGATHRSWNLVIGGEVGFGLGSRASSFGQALSLGLALDPYVELRVLPGEAVTVTVRGAVDTLVGPQPGYFITLGAGLGVRWD